MNKNEARRIARQRNAQVRAERDEAERRRREEAERKQAERDAANEGDLVYYFQAEAIIEDARLTYETVLAERTREMHEAAASLYARERNAKTVAELLGVTPAKVNAMRKAATAADGEPKDQTGEPVTDERAAERSDGGTGVGEPDVQSESSGAATMVGSGVQ